MFFSKYFSDAWKEIILLLPVVTTDINLYIYNIIYIYILYYNIIYIYMFLEYLIYMKGFKAFIKPFEAPQRSVKIKI